MKLILWFIIGTIMFVGLMGMILCPILIVVGCITDNEQMFISSLFGFIFSIFFYFFFGSMLPDERPTLKK